MQNAPGAKLLSGRLIAGLERFAGAAAGLRIIAEALAALGVRLRATTTQRLLTAAAAFRAALIVAPVRFWLRTIAVRPFAILTPPRRFTVAATASTFVTCRHTVLTVPVLAELRAVLIAIAVAMGSIRPVDFVTVALFPAVTVWTITIATILAAAEIGAVSCIAVALFLPIRTRPTVGALLPIAAIRTIRTSCAAVIGLDGCALLRCRCLFALAMPLRIAFALPRHGKVLAASFRTRTIRARIMTTLTMLSPVVALHPVARSA